MQENTAFDEDDYRKRRRPRARYSCLPCQRRKTKCDKEQPCESCRKRDTVPDCKWEEPVIDPASIAEDLAAELQSVRRRLGRVEHRVSDLERHSPAKQESHAVPAHSPGMHPPLSAHTPGTSLASTHYSDRPDHPVTTEEAEAVLVMESLSTSNNMITPSSFGKEISGVPQVRMTNEPPTWTAQADTAQRKELVGGSPSALANSSPYPTIRRQQPSANPSKRSRYFTSAPMEFVPSKELTETLVDVWFSDLSWLHCVMHAPTFKAQCNELYALQTVDQPVEIDPGWMAVFYLILGWSISYRLPKLRDGSIRTEQAREMASDWHSAAQHCLHASEWPQRPRIWALQAMILNMYFRTGLVATQRSDLITVYTWLSPAIRLAQLLGLHKLGNDPTVMPVDDPAFPPGRSAIKRETAKRIWSYLLTSDWLCCTHNRFSQITPEGFDTDRPWILIDEDMRPESEVPDERPSTHLTDTSFAQIQRVLANFQLAAFRSLQTRDKKYSTVLELENMLQAELDRIELINTFNSPRLQPYLVAMAKSTLSNRILRLHRPFYIAGWQSLTYAVSTSTCLRCATTISTSLETLAHSPIEGLWYLRTHAMGAGLIHFMDLYRETQSGLTGPRLGRKYQNLVAVRNYFHRTSGGPANMASPHIVFDSLLSAIFPHGPQAPPISPHDLPPLPNLLHMIANGGTPATRAAFAPLAQAGASPVARGTTIHPRQLHQPSIPVDYAHLSAPSPHHAVPHSNGGGYHESQVGPAAALPPPMGAFDDLDANWNALFSDGQVSTPMPGPHMEGSQNGLSDWNWLLSVGGGRGGSVAPPASTSSAEPQPSI